MYDKIKEKSIYSHTLKKINIDGTNFNLWEKEG